MPSGLEVDRHRRAWLLDGSLPGLGRVWFRFMVGGFAHWGEELTLRKDSTAAAEDVVSFGPDGNILGVGEAEADFFLLGQLRESRIWNFGRDPFWGGVSLKFGLHDME